MAQQNEGPQVEQQVPEKIIEDDEIEQHLLEKINHAILNLGKQQNLVTKCLQPDFGPEFEGLMEMLKDKEKPLKNVKPENWLSVRREHLYYLNNLISEWQMTKNRSSFSAKEVYDSCENIKKSLKKMTNDLKGVQDPSSRVDTDAEGSTHHHQEPNHPIFEPYKKEVYRWSSRQKPRNVYGFQHLVMAMERDLVMHNTDAPYKVFGVVGVAGIGKTTLCQDIFNRDLVEKHYCPRLWVCLSNQPNPRKDYKQEIIVRILKCLGVEDEVIGEENADDPYQLKRLILLLRLQLTGKRYLLVLDDAWNNDKFFLNLTQKDQLVENWAEELAYGLPKGCGGTIISSSRSSVLLKNMLGYHVRLHHIERHTNEIIEKIFVETVKGYDEDEKEYAQHLIDLKNEIFKKCDGIPLAAKLLAKIARDPLPLKAKAAPLKAKAAPVDLEIRPVGVPAGGVQRMKEEEGGGEDGQRKGGFVPKSKHKSGLH